MCEAPLALVQCLGYADHFALHRPDRHAEDVAGDEARLLIDRAVEALIVVRVVDVERFAVREHEARDTGGVRQPVTAAHLALRASLKALVGSRFVYVARAGTLPHPVRFSSCRS